LQPRGVGLVGFEVPRTLPASATTFRALRTDERSYLLDWRTRVRGLGIDAVEDLASRPWPCPVAETIIGIYKKGDAFASWLVVGHAGCWAVSCCDDGTVSGSLGSLVDALSLVSRLRFGGIARSTTGLC
jgi:hypothetical protein